MRGANVQATSRPAESRTVAQAWGPGACHSARACLHNRRLACAGVSHTDGCPISGRLGLKLAELIGLRPIHAVCVCGTRLAPQMIPFAKPRCTVHLHKKARRQPLRDSGQAGTRTQSAALTIHRNVELAWPTGRLDALES